jgi:hypothetical protein
MKERVNEIANASPRLLARIAGILYLFSIVAGMFAFLTDDSLVGSDAAATANNIMASELLYRFAFAVRLSGLLAFVVMTAVLYRLLRPVNAPLAVAAAFCSLVGCTIHGMNMANHNAPFFFLGDATYLGAFEPAQLQALARVSLRSYSLTFNIGLVFFGLSSLLIGLLILRSTFIPKLIGVLMMIGGASFVLERFATFLYPAFAATLPDYTLLPDLLAEGALALWLALFGVNSEKWKTQAGAPALA